MADNGKMKVEEARQKYTLATPMGMFTVEYTDAEFVSTEEYYLKHGWWDVAPGVRIYHPWVQGRKEGHPPKITRASLLAKS